MQYYFAYGSNLNPARKHERTGEADDARVVVLEDYRLVFDKVPYQRKQKGGYANVVPCEGEVVWGVVYRCSDAALQVLDKYEGVHINQYERVATTVIDRSGDAIEAHVYLALVRDELLLPRVDYLHHLITGAQHHLLPEDYIQFLQAHPTV